jgi:hypothetical protein
LITVPRWWPIWIVFRKFPSSFATITNQHHQCIRHDTKKWRRESWPLSICESTIRPSFWNERDWDDVDKGCGMEMFPGASGESFSASRARGNWTEDQSPIKIVPRATNLRKFEWKRDSWLTKAVPVTFPKILLDHSIPCIRKARWSG